MALTEGTMLGPYEILSPLGAGGMGEVYRARDSRLGREVAVKVLPAHVAADPDALARFEREARAVAGLSHPNILAIHDFGVQEGIAYSVTELLEGQTLRQRMGGAKLPVRKVLDYGVQVAHGLAAAHDKGVIHRDLKPENIFITEDGRAKILDFGLAKLERPEGDDLTSLPTEAGTRPGTVLGTMGYMSPEQLRGQEVDARSDLFAFGSVLYEMLSGQQAFRRDTAADTMSAILREDPPLLSGDSGEVAPPLQRIVEHCLEKSPAERFQSARDLAFHLDAVGGGSGSAASAVLPGADSAPVRRGAPRAALFAAGVAVGLVAGALLSARLLAPAPHEPPTLRYLSYSGHDNEPSASPDGRLIAYTSVHAGTSRIWVKQFPGGNEVALTEGPDDRLPRISPDGAQVLFTRVESGEPSLFRVALVGGDPRKVVDDARDGEWSPDGSQVAFLRERYTESGSETTLGIADAAGQSSRDLVTMALVGLWGPRWSPDGRTIAVGRTNTENAPSTILLVDVASGTTQTLQPPPPAGRLSASAWTADGRALVYTQSESYVSGGEQVSGRLVVQDVASGRAETRMWLPITATVLDILAPGTAVMGVTAQRQNLVEVSLEGGAIAGRARWITRGGSSDRQPVFSPDGRWMLFSSNRGGNLDLWKLSVETGAIRRITEDSADDWDPAFTPDGESILWSSNRGGHFEIWTCAADGTGARQLSQDGLDAENPTTTPDGEWIVYNSSNPAHSGIWKMHRDGSEATLLVPGSWSVPDVSPDGRFVAFREASEPRTVRVARVEDGKIVAGPWPMPGSQYNGRARWMPDGRRLLFTGSDESGARGIFIQDFVPGRDTRDTRRPFLGFDEDQPPESLGVSPDGRRLVYSAADIVDTLMLAEGLVGVTPARTVD